MLSYKNNQDDFTTNNNFKKQLKNKNLIEYYNNLIIKYKDIKDILDEKTDVGTKNKKLDKYFTSSKETQYAYITRNKALMEKSENFNDILEKRIQNFPKKSNKSADMLILIKSIPEFNNFSFLCLIEIISDQIPIEDFDTKIKLSDVLSIFVQIFKRKLIDEKFGKNINEYREERDSYRKFLNEEKNIKRIRELSCEIIACLEESGLITIKKSIPEGAKTKKNLTNYIIFTKELVKICFKFRFKKENYPTLITPEDWSIKTTLMPNDYIDDLGASKRKYLMHFNINRSKSTTVSTESIEIINKLQRQTFKVNQIQLNFLMNNLLEILKKSKIKIDLNEYFDFEDFKKDVIGKNESIFNSTKMQTNLKYSYKQELLKAFNILETIFIAFLYRKHDFFFSIYLDSRARVYYNGYLLKPQGTVLAKSLLNLKNEDNLISADVRSSGYQILGLIFRNQKLLKLTHLIEDDGENPDLYEYLRVKFNKKYNKTINIKNDINYNKNFTSKMLSYYENEKDFVLNPEITDRSIIKFICIRLIYGQGERNTMFELKDLYKGELNAIKATIFTKLIYNFLNEELEQIFTLKQICREVVNYNVKNSPDRPIVLYSNARFARTTQFYVEQKIKKITFIDYNNKKKSISLKVDIKPYKADKVKNHKSIIANLIHTLDSLILFRVLHFVQKLNIPIYTIHDCFVIPKKHLQTLQSIYTKVTEDLYKEDILKNFVKNNIDDITIKKNLIEIIANNTDKKEINLIFNNKNPLKIEDYIFNIQDIINDTKGD